MLNTGQIFKIQSSTESWEGDLLISRTIYELEKSGILNIPDALSVQDF